MIDCAPLRFTYSTGRYCGVVSEDICGLKQRRRHTLLATNNIAWKVSKEKGLPRSRWRNIAQNSASLITGRQGCT